MDDSITTEDRGDGRSRVHVVHVDARVVLHLTVQRERVGLYVAHVHRVGLAHPVSPHSGEGATVEEAVAAAARAVGCRVERPT